MVPPKSPAGLRNGVFGNIAENRGTFFFRSQFFPQLVAVCAVALIRLVLLPPPCFRLADSAGRPAKKALRPLVRRSVVSPGAVNPLGRRKELGPTRANWPT